MNGFSERDTVFLNEMGLGPLWMLRAAPGQAAAAAAVAEDGGVAVAEVEVVAIEAEAPVVVAQPAPRASEPAPASEAPPAPPPAGPRPLQRVAQSASALEAVPEPPLPGNGYGADLDSAWDDAALPADASPEEIARMDWDQLAVAIASCRRCSACRDGRAPVPGTGAKQARWLVAAGASTAADDRERLPLAGEPGKLLDNMLAAVGMGRDRDVYITNLIKCRPASPNGGERAPTAAEAAACRPYLEREAVLTGSHTVLTLGQIAANTLLGRPLQEPLAGARGSVHPLAIGGGEGDGQGQSEVSLVATLHPGELLRRGGDKALAWADLCRARAAQKAGGARPAR
ncbi:uracil-DNA glycosylase [Massilia sp. YIM B02763]|uniref:uracil-DNA glycosylase n=1 Tax=Massilia sp. YIM B02763 TaxID=3050130 RepID=UPI0025B6D43E|nr:uracil-DNA glycosylase [Massilia sp. YIM B02763]MDN4055882.1 uracil-DNA glycosylase [Massilia sp. YIM B02763]